MTRRAALLLAWLLIPGVAVGQTQPDARRAAYLARMERLFSIDQRAQQARPYRRESPSREENITDNEVREIQVVTANIVPGAILNIGTVVVGCPCEDGQSCSNQVWVVAHRPEKTKGLLLSKISGHWAVGPVQQWWFDREDLEARRKSFPSVLAYIDAEDALTGRFPACRSQASTSGGERASATHPSQ